MKYDYHLIIIGAGSAGLVVASGSSQLGAKVALIESNKMGGDCLNYGCIPSKSFLRSAHIASQLKNGNHYGLGDIEIKVNIENIMDGVKSIIKEIEPNDSKERYEKMGVDVFKAHGRLINRNTVQIGNKTITGKIIVIATGSRPMIPDIKGLKNIPFYTNETIFSIKTLPEKLIVLGGGPIGCELGQGFSHLGSKVTIIDRSKKLFKKDDPEVGPLMLKKFEYDGIDVNLEAKILEIKGEDENITVIIEKNGKIQNISGTHLLLALGRKPDTQNMGIEKLGISLSKKGHIVTNKKLQSNIKNIYACGDVTGPYAYTHIAGYQGSIVVQNAIFPFKKKVDYAAIPWVTYTSPEVAHVGYTENQLINENVNYKKYLVPLKENDRAITERNHEGFLKILTNNKKVILGSTIVGEKAGEQIGLANIAVVNKMKLNSFNKMIFPYPTELEIYKKVSFESLKDTFKPWHKKLIKKLFLK